jgi:hypothetical protein
MMILTVFLLLLVAHYVGDFICQTHWQATNKSKSHEALARHVAVYTLVIGIVAAVLLGPTLTVLAFILINGALHYWVDFWTSRISSGLFIKGRWHDFFAIIGLDQLLHQACLGVSLQAMF